MNKRGEGHQLFFAMEVVLGLLVAGILIGTATNFDALSNINKLYAKEDLKLLVETIQVGQGSIEYDYKIKSLYTVNINLDPTQEDVQVTSTGTFLEGYNYYNLTLKKEQGTKQIGVEKNA